MPYLPKNRATKTIKEESGPDNKKFKIWRNGVQNTRAFRAGRGSPVQVGFGAGRLALPTERHAYNCFLTGYFEPVLRSRDSLPKPEP